MLIEKGTFLAFVASIAAAGGAGYVASEKDIVPHLDGRSHATPSKTEVSSAPISAAHVDIVAVDAGAAAQPLVAAPITPTPACDDSVGEAPACPQMTAPTDEGGCGGFATARCADFKATMKPRVAQAAVTCLNKLTGAERCDPKRVELCGHLALMNACDDSAATSTVTSTCEKIAQTCGDSPLAASKTECRLTMSGLRETGREAMLDCAKKHCFDKGVLGCEAVAPAKP